jgi:hypothetical protein
MRAFLDLPMLLQTTVNQTPPVRNALASIYGAGRQA